ncbi:MAG: fluoride efflux transporter CrcB [Candidatus Thermoplasmatota archaeon]|nr:fluoride efflux transporter CrcB [Candidatus Thermoplasmatota archaeon]MED5485823.1 fluoride efflux transporter CrcB [Candidatus Thermoplasmatota archaeon]MEE3134258.1 fluoride efflux transporter CrcB [Candidatus Thermoplasmatota archaeon]
MDPKDLLLVAIGGALGASLRYLVILWIPTEGFPWSTLSVNLIGSFILGIIIGFSTNQLLDEKTTLMIATGVLGAFTTMSTYSMDTITLWENEKILAILYIIATAIIGPILALIGMETVNSGIIFNKN